MNEIKHGQWIGDVVDQNQVRLRTMLNIEKRTPGKGDLPVLEVAKRADYFSEAINDSEQCEYFVSVKWLQTVAIDKAVQEIGFFGNQNTICKPTTPKWRNTVERLKQAFPKWDK